jgi:hypothetical protein
MMTSRLSTLKPPRTTALFMPSSVPEGPGPFPVKEAQPQTLLIVTQPPSPTSATITTTSSSLMEEEQQQKQEEEEPKVEDSNSSSSSSNNCSGNGLVSWAECRLLVEEMSRKSHMQRRDLAVAKMHQRRAHTLLRQVAHRARRLDPIGIQLKVYKEAMREAVATAVTSDDRQKAVKELHRYKTAVRDAEQPYYRSDIRLEYTVNQYDSDSDVVESALLLRNNTNSTNNDDDDHHQEEKRDATAATAVASSSNSKQKKRKCNPTTNNTTTTTTNTNGWGGRRTPAAAGTTTKKKKDVIAAATTTTTTTTAEPQAEEEVVVVVEAAPMMMMGTLKGNPFTTAVKVVETAIMAMGP